jgi:hypothetical protein
MSRRQREIKVILERRGKQEVFVMEHTAKGNSLTQATLQPKKKNKLGCGT